MSFLFLLFFSFFLFSFSPFIFSFHSEDIAWFFFINRRSSLRIGVVPDPLVRKTKSDVGRSHKRHQ